MNTCDPIDILARTIWAEARGEPKGGMEAVASVILNRARNPRWWGKDIVSVCLCPRQFSCWNKDDPNCPKLQAVDGSDPDFVRALAIADKAVNGKLSDPTGNADSYADLRACHPDWAATHPPVCQIGGHTFFRLELAAPAQAA
jgi:spore germination cell wall hydrolase CwlJ-like protein